MVFPREIIVGHGTTSQIAELCNRISIGNSALVVADKKTMKLSGEEIIKRKIVDEKTYRQMEKAALDLFDFGTKYVAENNLILVDTKYEFGLDESGNLVLIDEIHTPDSSRYWIKDTYEDLFSKGEDPQKLDKEYKVL